MYLGFIVFVDDQANVFVPNGVGHHELLMAADFTVLKRHAYLDSLLGYPEYSSDLFEHLHPIDLLRLSKLQEDIMVRGYSEQTLRYLCYSEQKQSRWLLVFSRIFPYVDQSVIESSGAFLIVFIWPFAFLEESKEHTIDDKGVCSGVCSGIKFISPSPPAQPKCKCQLFLGADYVN